MAILLLTVNAGSASLRLALHELRAAGDFQRIEFLHLRGAGPWDAELARFAGGRNLAVAAHRIVHGGNEAGVAALIDSSVEHAIESAVPLAPLHNPAALAGIRALRDACGTGLPQVAVYDTGFFLGLPEAARSYALPARLVRDLGLRRSGFHGLAHQALWQRWLALSGKAESRVISLQLGSGCSAAAIAAGKPIDTSMGFSPLEGLVMATRCGDIDPGLLLYLQQRQNWSVTEMQELLYRESGLRGIAGTADMRVLLDEPTAQAQQAVELFCHRARKYVGGYLALLGGADALLFGGGVGEHAWPIRARILQGMEWAGIRVDPSLNEAAVGVEQRISAAGSRIEVWVIPVDEDRLLLEHAVACLKDHGDWQPQGEQH